MQIIHLKEDFNCNNSSIPSNKFIRFELIGKGMLDLATIAFYLLAGKYVVLSFFYVCQSSLMQVSFKFCKKWFCKNLLFVYSFSELIKDGPVYESSPNNKLNLRQTFAIYTSQ